MAAEFDRRRLMRAATGLACAGGVLLRSALISPAAAAGEGGLEKGMEQVTPPEDLMREHGVLDRLLLVYEATMRRFASNESVDPSIISQAAQFIREFIEDYHERNEQDYVFPRFRKAGKLVDLVGILYQQHQAGRRLTDTITHLAPASVTAGEDRNRLIATMRAFVTMYRPHEAREDTVLFPALRSVVTANEFDSMAEDFEKNERRKFGQDGFEKMVEQVAALERALGIADLRAFTPT